MATETNTRLVDYEELFKIPGMTHWEAGLFDYEIKIEHTTDDIMNELNDWLCDNCLENFVVLRITEELVAGGRTDPRQAWDRRKKLGPPEVNCKTSTSDRGASLHIHIRLCNIDIMGFRLTWIL